MKKISRLQVTAWVLSLLPAAMTAVFYSRLPAEIPMQWDLAASFTMPISGFRS